MTAPTPNTVKPVNAETIVKHFWKVVCQNEPNSERALLNDHPWILKERARKEPQSKEYLPFVRMALHLDAPDLAAYAVDHGAPLEDTDPMGWTALHSVLAWLKVTAPLNKENFTPLIDKMIARGARCDSLSNAGEPLWYTAMDMAMPVFKKLIEKGSPLDFIDTDGCSGLSYAICQAPLEKVAFLIESGANVNLFEQRAMTHAPLLCAFHRQAPEIADLLLQSGARLDLKDGFGRTFLHHAQSPQAVSWLIENGLDLEAKDVFGRTPLLHLINRITQKPDPAFSTKAMQNVAKAMILAGANLETRDRQDTSLSARDVIVSHPDRMMDLNNMLRSMVARQVARQAMIEMNSPLP